VFRLSNGQIFRSRNGQIYVAGRHKNGRNVPGVSLAINCQLPAPGWLSFRCEKQW
jgi:hypothetical protein